LPACRQAGAGGVGVGIRISGNQEIGGSGGWRGRKIKMPRKIGQTKESNAEKKNKPSIVLCIRDLIQIYAEYISPPSLFKFTLCKEQRDIISALVPEVYVAFCFSALLIILLNIPTNTLLLAIIISFRLFDIFVYALSTLFVSPEKLFDPFRSVLIALINYIEIIFVFSIWYKWSGIVYPFYTSVCVITPLGVTEGTAKIFSSNIWLSFISGLEALIGVFFVAIVIARFVNALSVIPRRK
jgi:hypothetical protein